MIGFLNGIIEQLTKEYVILMTAGGVGYRVFMPLCDLADLSVGAPAKMWVHTSVREDAITLFGFIEEGAYNLFELLLTVKGVGPKIALGILSSTRPEGFVAAVQNKDLQFLTSLPGIGKKGAERLLLELKDKLGTAPEIASGKNIKTAIDSVGPVGEAVDALVSLGYARNEIMPIVEQIPEVEKLSGEEILRRALKLFARS